MIPKAKNKDMATVKAKQNKAAVLVEYFFAGGGEYLPLTVFAESQEKANEIYILERVKINNK